MRFETGSTSDAVFASQTVVSAKAAAAGRCARDEHDDRGSSTAVVSRLRNAVLTTASRTTKSQSSHARPRAARAVRSATAAKTPASAASSATTVIATANSRIGQTRSADGERIRKRQDADGDGRAAQDEQDRADHRESHDSVPSRVPGCRLLHRVRMGG